MPRILLTAFEPYDCWPENSSWLALIEFTKRLDGSAKVTTRLYPTDLAAAVQRLEEDLAGQHDYVLHLGQAPGAAQLRLEAIGVNVATESAGHPDQVRTLVPDGPVAYRSRLPLAQWAEMLRQAGIPASVSYHAGTYLCNAILYLSHYYIMWSSGAFPRRRHSSTCRWIPRRWLACRGSCRRCRPPCALKR